eukprot:CAMPEP_0201640320 /NCGR_PEP_ID=MMETSP0493-20130528/21515_1 /ASSEMBLY_ACC=CAM_ASM_000838 /TAXON_ID=420259 /ORGANISM="Thalassiosira gravida, Strain GMp14c1" /LENGTH=39 /DNA_ID= /DNA_START= /DNA_END= /DNA_ORIENTATION=
MSETDDLPQLKTWESKSSGIGAKDDLPPSKYGVVKCGGV